MRRFCRFHDIALKATRRLELAHADSPANLQIAFTQVVSAMLEGRVDQQKGRLCLYGLRLASDNMKRLSDETYGSWDGNLQPSRP